MPSLTLELSQKTPKNYVFEQIFKHSRNFEPLPPLISGLNSKFDYATLCGGLLALPPQDQEGLRPRAVLQDLGLNILLYEKQTRLINSNY